MARKLPTFERILGGEAIMAIVYAEISSSLYFALGIVSLWALGLTPLVLILVGLLFGLAASAYSEGVTTLDEGGGASAIARRAFGDLVGFVVGWVVVLDLVVVIALSLLFVPHYAAAAVGRLDDLRSPADAVVAVVLVAVLAAALLTGRARMGRLARPVAALDLIVQGGLVLLGLVLVLDVDRLTGPLELGVAPSWNAVAYSLPIALIAFTGIEIVANLLREATEPVEALHRDTVVAVAGTIVIYAVIAALALTAFPVGPAPGAPSGYASEISTTWLNAPLAGLAEAVGDEIGPAVGTVLRVLVGLSAVLILLFSALTAYAGATRLLGSLARSDALPRFMGRPSRRAPAGGRIVAVPALGVPFVLVVASFSEDEASGLAGIYSFGILLAFMAVFLGVVWLRVAAPELERPLRMRLEFRFLGTRVPATALIGFALSWVLFVLTLGSHPSARIVPPLWLLGGLVLYVVARRQRGASVLGSGQARAAAPPLEVTEVRYGTIVVPVKQAGPIEEEMLAVAAKLAASQDARVLALQVTEVPLSDPIDVRRPEDEERDARLRRMAETFASDYGVPVELRLLRSRAISQTIAAEARAAGAGLILIGAVPHFTQRAGRLQVFSETVENLLRKAHCRVIVTSFPAGTTASPPDPPAGAVAEAPR